MIAILALALGLSAPQVALDQGGVAQQQQQDVQVPENPNNKVYEILGKDLSGALLPPPQPLRPAPPKGSPPRAQTSWRR